MYSCTTPDYLPESDLYAYVADEGNGLSKSVNAGKVTMKMSHRPNDFMIWQELEGETDTTRIMEVFKRYDNYLYFLMQLSSGDKNALYGTSANQADFNDKLQTLSFRMGQYANLTTSEQDTVPVADAYYTRMFGLSKSSDVLLVFNKEKIDQDQWVSVNTKEFGFKTGRRSFRFKMEDINAAPKLKELAIYYELIENN